jgi:copper chaperone CopZ
MNNLATQSKMAGIVLFMMLFLSFSTEIKAQNSDKQQQEQVYIKAEIKGMACPYCAFGMEKKLKEISGVSNVTIELKEGLAYISTLKKQKPNKEDIQNIILNAGFTPGKIMYSDTPFVKKEVKKDD